MKPPAIFVLVDRDKCVPRFAEAHVRERRNGPTLYRYLRWRDGKVREYYMGSVTPQNGTRLHQAAPGEKIRSTEARRPGQLELARVLWGKYRLLGFDSRGLKIR